MSSRLHPAPVWVAPAAAAIVALAGCATLAVSDTAADLVPPCPFRAVSGLDCPLCGATRALRATAAGNLGTAAGHNLLLVAAVPLLVGAWVAWSARRLGRPSPRWRPPPWLLRCAVATVAAFAVLRNLPVPGLDWLASDP